jgi:copper(I)-binding protein
MRHHLAIPLASVLVLTGCGASDQAPGVRVEDARVTLPAVKGRPGAAYFSITATGAPARITGVTSPRVQRIELHESMAAGMGPLRDTTLPAGTAVSFAPGGKHAMLFGIDPALKVGQRVPIVVSFDQALAVTVQAEVQGPGGGGAH